MPGVYLKHYRSGGERLAVVCASSTEPVVWSFWLITSMRRVELSTGALLIQADGIDYLFWDPDEHFAGSSQLKEIWPIVRLS
jgi:hypothetical protein